MTKPLKAMTPPTSGPLRLLLLDDHPADAELAVLELERAGYQVTAEITQNLEDFSARLRTNYYDFLLSDYNLGSSTGMDAFSVLQALKKDIPFILLTGTLGDELAVDCIKQGVTDVVLKDKMVRLSLAVRRALAEQGLRAEQNLAQRSLQESEERYRRLVEVSPDAVLVNCDSRIVFANPAALRLLGATTPDQLLGRPALEFVHSDYRQVALERTWRSAKRQLPAPPLEEKFIRLDGSTVDVEVIGIPFRWSDQPAVQVIARDISERKRSEEALRLSEEKFAKAFGSNPSAITISTLRDGRYVDVNGSFLQMTGFHRSEVIGRTAVDLGFWVNPEARAVLLEALSQQGKVLDFEFLFRTKNGEQRLGVLSGEMIPVGGETCLLAIVRDDTDRRLAEQALEQNRELEERNREIERATKLKSQFLASMSHELRTPLTAILGFIGLLIDEIAGPLNDKQRRFAEHTRNGANHLLQLINDILDLSKIEAGQVELHQESFALAEALPEVLSLIRPLVMKKKVRLESQTSDLRIYADRIRFKQVLYNLLSNATKFTPEGGVIRLACSREGDQVQISVSDTGIGIATEDQRVIFEEFRQVGPTTGGLKEGTGLGLAITRRLLEQQGGRIWVESQVGQGSCFAFTLPAGAPVTEGTRPGNPSDHRAVEGRLVLIVESDESARELLVSYLQPEGYRTATSRPGTSAIEMAAKLRPDAITLNTLTPGRGGWETLASLKMNPATAEIPVIIVSVVDQRRMGFAMGAAEYLVKPVARPALLRAVQKWVPQQKEASILVTDDDPAVVEMVREFLTGAGYRVLTAYDGRQALRLLDQQHPDALVLDLMMPQLDGFEVISQIRQNPQLRELPILVLTAKDLTDDDLELLSRDTRALLRKDFSWREELLRQINQVVRHTRCALEAK